MAKVTLTFEDNADGTLHFMMESDPPLKRGNDDNTGAQLAAMYAAQMAMEMLEDCSDSHEVMEVTGGEEPSGDGN